MISKDSKTSLHLMQLQLDLAQEELKQLRSSRRSLIHFLSPLLLAFSVLLVFPHTTANAISSSVSSGEVTNHAF